MSAAIAAAGIVAGGAIIGGGISAGASAGWFGGGGGGVNTGSIKKMMEEYVGQVRAAAANLTSQASGYAAGAKKEVKQYANDLRGASDAETKAFWNNLGIFNEGLINSASALVDTYDGDVSKAVEKLVSTVTQLNEGYASDMGAEIERYGSVEDAINSRLVADKDVAETKFLDRVNQFQSEYKQNTSAEIDRTRAESDAFIGQFAQTERDTDTRKRDEDQLSENVFRSDLAQVNRARELTLDSATRDYRGTVTDESRALESAGMSLGDRFMAQANEAQQLYAKSMADITQRMKDSTISVDARVEAERALNFNLENVSKFASLADTLSQTAQKTRMDMLATADPRALELSAQVDEIASASLGGRIDSETQANLARSGAMRALQGGFAGGEMQRNLEARDLGLTALDLQNRGAELYDKQRRLNFDTRVAGLQVTGADIMANNGLSSEQAIRSAQLNADRSLLSATNMAEMEAAGAGTLLGARRSDSLSDYQNRMAAISAATGYRIGAAGDIFSARDAESESTRRLGTATSESIFNARRDTSRESAASMSAMNRDEVSMKLGALNRQSDQRLASYDTIFGSQMGVADTLRVQDMTLASTLNANQRDANVRSSGMRIAATQDIYNNVMGLSDTVFNTSVGLAGQKFSTGLSVTGDIYKTNTSAADSIYKTRLGLEQTIFGGKTDTSIAAMRAETDAAIAGFGGIANALGNQAGTNANLPIINAASRNASSMQSAQLWGSALQSGSSLAGSYLGNANWSNLGGNRFGGSGYNTYGGYNPTSSSPYYGNVSSASARPVAMPT